MNIIWVIKLMFVEKYEDMFEGLGLFKCPLTTYNNEFPNSFINLYVLFIKIILYDAKHGSKYSPLKSKNCTSILYNDVVNTVAYVVDRGI